MIYYNTGSSYCPAYSTAISVLFSNEGNELVSLAEAKTYLRIDAGETAFDDQVMLAISAARMTAEKYLNRSLISRYVTAVMNIANGIVSLPYAPVISFLTTVVDKDGNDIDQSYYTVNGDTIHMRGYNQATFNYHAGYEVLPPVFKLGILKLLAFDWQHPGDDGAARSIGAITGLKMYRRVV